MTARVSPPLLEIDRDRVARIVADVVRDRLGVRRRAEEPTTEHRPVAGVCPPPREGMAVSPGSQRRPGARPLVVNISVRHMHITQEHLEILFGPGAELTPLRWLYQEGQFASAQTVDLVGPKRRMLQQVRILGPVRPATQIELAFSDAILLGIDVPVRMSGKIEGTPGCILLGPRGHLVLEQGVIRAQRHVHMAPSDAADYGVAHGAGLDLVIEHPTCGLRLGGVMVRVDPRFKLEVHLDSDEGNACDLPGATGVRLERPAHGSVVE
ncbi:MAG: phosphate propanoyltransferase [Phycisphaerales bacterium]|nr:phosphate propanoyltransferase [Phycisphaerales bacterium]